MSDFEQGISLEDGYCYSQANGINCLHRVLHASTVISSCAPWVMTVGALFHD